MTNLTAAAGLTAGERSALAGMMTALAGGGAASLTNGPNASEHNRSFVELLRDLSEAGLLDQRHPARPGAADRSTGTLTSAWGVAGELEDLAAAARAGNDALVVALGEGTSPSAIEARQEAAAAREERIRLLEQGIPPPDIPPPPGYDRDMNVIDPGLAFPPGTKRPTREPVAVEPGAIGTNLRAAATAPSLRRAVEALPGPRTDDILLDALDRSDDDERER